MAEDFKRHVAYKMVIGDVLTGRPTFDGEKFKALEIEDKQVSRVNIVANIIDKYIQDDEKKFASVTLDDASGQIKLKNFGDDIHKFENFSQGDTVMVIGLLRSWNNEVYITPEIIKKKDPQYLLIRKLEVDSTRPKKLDKSEINEVINKILSIIKREEENGGTEITKIAQELAVDEKIVNQEIKKLLEEGVIYEPRPGKVRYLG